MFDNDKILSIVQQTLTLVQQIQQEQIKMGTGLNDAQAAVANLTTMVASETTAINAEIAAINTAITDFKAAIAAGGDADAAVETLAQAITAATGGMSTNLSNINSATATITGADPGPQPAA